MAKIKGPKKTNAYPLTDMITVIPINEIPGL